MLESCKDDSDRLNRIAWTVVDPDRQQPPDSRLARIALKAAKRAEELTKGENVALLDTLACALYRDGDYAGAAATEERALRRLEKEAKDRSHPYFQEFAKRLELFRQAAKEKGGTP